jgi:hypothetical protein
MRFLATYQTTPGGDPGGSPPDSPALVGPHKGMGCWTAGAFLKVVLTYFSGFGSPFLSLLSGIDILDALPLVLEVEAFPAVVFALGLICWTQHYVCTVGHNLPNTKLVNGSSKI